MYLIITIDTECDDAWAKRHRVTTENVTCLPRFQALCEGFGFKPTYLATYEMAVDPRFVAFARDIVNRGTGEVGMHPHPWNNPPSYELTTDDMRLHPFMIEYPVDIVAEKLSFLNRILEESIGVKVRSHRAGRWIMDETYAKLLVELGYEVDCSVTPFVRWEPGTRPESELRARIPDYRCFPVEPYFLNADDISTHGDLPILELPMTIFPNYGPVRSTLYSMLGFRMPRRMFRAVAGTPVLWFRPTRRNGRTLLRLARHVMRSGRPYLMFMLHSSEFMAGGSPMFQSEADIERLYADLWRVFGWLNGEGVTGVTCAEYREIYARTKAITK